MVHDHIPYRLKGANGRYSASGTGGVGNGKRAFKFLFHKGYEFDAIDQAGNKYPEKWSTMITENLWENRATLTFSLNEMVGFHLYNQLGIPSPRGHWSQFRTIMQTAEQPDKWNGDFWGMMWVHEDYDRRFLAAHDLKKGNLYKLTRDATSGLEQLRYQSAFGPTNGSDHDELLASLNGTSTPAYITARVNLDLWCRQHAFCEAIRNYDYWPTGDNNSAYYFYPNYNAANGNKGVLWYLPNDIDATWGPTWNNGHDLVHNSIFNDSGSGANPTLWPNYFNQIREIRRLLWQPDQVNPLIDEFAAVIRPVVNAEFARWVGGPAATGNFGGLSVYGPSGTATIDLSGGSPVGATALDHYVAGMKDFAFDANGGGSEWPGGAIGAGGTAARLDTIASLINPLLGGTEVSRYPATPTITFTGTAGFPVNDLRFTTSAFSDPQNDVFGGIQWRVAAVNVSATWTAGVKRLLELNASHDSGERATFAAEYKFPVTACQPGQRYRARVRMKDTTGRWSLWSNAAEFTAGTYDPSALASQIVVSEIMYHATDPTLAERNVAAALMPPQSWNDDSFDYVELRNISAVSVDLGGCQFVAGFDFVFPSPTIVAPGANILVVANVQAFATRYPGVHPIAGAWDANDRLSNGGEALTLQFGLITPAIFSFIYDDDSATNWPTLPDGGGASLVKIEPENLARNPGHGINWRSSTQPNPGGDDRENFINWQGAMQTPDHDGNGVDNIAEYVLGANPFSDSRAALPTGALQEYNAGGGPATYATLTFPRATNREDVQVHVEFTTILTTWPIPGVLVSRTDIAPGLATEVWRSTVPVSANTRLFGRVRFYRP